MAKHKRGEVGRRKGNDRSGRQARPADAALQQAGPAVREAIAHLENQNLAAASAAIEAGLRIAPDHPDLLHLGGQVAMYAGDIPDGIRLIQAAIKRAPKIALYHYNLGNAYAANDELENALKSFRQAVRLDPRSADAFANIGIVLVKLQRTEEAEAAFIEAARLEPRNPQMQMNVAICSMELRHPDKTVAAIERIEQLLPEPDAESLHKIGNLYRGLGRHYTAEDYYRRALEQAPDAGQIWFALGDVLAQAGEHDKAIEALEAAERNGFELGPVKLALARVAGDRGEIARSKALLEEAAALCQDNVVYLHRIAHQYTLIGDFDAQERCLKRVLKLDPDNVAAFSGMAFAPGRKLSGDEADHLCKLAQDGSVDVDTRRNIGFALGDYFRYKKQFDDSFKYYRLGNRLKGYSFDRAEFMNWLSWVESTIDQRFFAERASWGSPSRMPVLIVGMPRSGTTLTEQILSSHPAIFGAGEYGGVASLARTDDLPVPDLRRKREIATALTESQVAAHARAYLAKMSGLATGGETFVTNKLPHNFIQLGLFGLLFPQAPIIHIKRDPRDNLLSIYFQDFAGFHDYAYDLKTLGLYYRLYERLMAHWTRVIPNPVYELHYEDLVADLPTKAHELADFVGVEWDEHMLRFYEQERMVQTASKWQVRQKLYTTSVSRWKPYEKHLNPLFDALDAS